MSKINLFWYAKALLSEDTKFGNFGDELGPYLIGRLSGQSIKHVPIPRTSIKLILAYFKGLINKVYSWRQFPDIVRCFFLNGNYIISVGSIIAWGSGKRKVWGSGILFENDKISNGTFYAVRGKYSQERLAELGYQVPEVTGDPALLLPLVYNPEVEKENKLGIVPHHTQFEHFAPYQEQHGIKVINLLDDIERVIDHILSCQYIISSSLHGLIVAQAYGIPALWYYYPHINWYGEDIKFLDYLSSVDIEEYEPLELKEINEFVVEKEIEKFLEYKNVIYIKNDLNKIQQDLISAAPFPIKKSFQNLEH